uniref:Synaptobrevin, longin-like domain protein n=1 Tax=Tanacetum cinerariifolium TaxID=118510 RepID=A0A6L2JL72_TANCI|nr:hypothetical protein [Tanacetum cinerariifolium]
MARLAFCDYHNMIAILEKYEHNTNFHQIVDFVEASHLKYALTINPTVYVSHIRQFWSTARIETTDEGTKILATVDGKPRTIYESSIRINLKLRDEVGISSLPDAELFKNLTLMGYNILPNQKFSFQKATNRVYNFSKMIFDGMVRNVNNKVSKNLMYPRVNSSSFLGRTVPLFESMLITMGEGSGTPTEPHHTPSPEAPQTSPATHSSPSLPPVTTEPLPTIIPTDTPLLRQYTRRARIAQSSALPPVADEPTSPIGDDSQGEACPTDSGLEAKQDRANITKTSTLPSDSTPRVTSLAADEGSMQQKLNELMDLCTRLQRQQDEMASKITAQDLEISALKARIKHLEDRDGGDDDPSREYATIKGMSVETREEAGIERSTNKGSNDTKEMVNVLTSLDAASILTSGVQVSVSPAAEVTTASIPPAGELFTTATMTTPYSRRKEMSIEERIELINDLVKYQDNYAKVLKYQTQQRKPLSKKQQREFYISVLRSHAGWKTKHFKGMQLEEIREKFVPVWKQIEDFVPMGSKEEGERFKRKGLRLEQESVKQVKTSEEVSEEDLKTMMQLVPVEEVYVEALQHFDREDLNQLWALVKETLSIRPATSDKEKELWVELKRLYEPDVEDQLWTYTQALIHDPVEWRLYDSCGVHHVLSGD